MSPKGRRRLLVLLSLAGLGAIVWSLRSRVLARNEADFVQRYGDDPDDPVAAGNGVSGV